MAASAAWAIIVGTPLLAVGITASPVIEIVAACLLATGCVLVALLQIRVAWRQGSPTALTLLSASSMSLLAGMGLALFYAASEFLAAAWIDIPTMIPLHGTANAFGFALLGLLGWSLAERR
jgi:ABC-type Fe3+ transport system permease subunit